MQRLFVVLACLSVLVVGCGEDTKRSVGPSAAAAKVATDDSSTPAAGDDSSTPATTPATTPESVWASLKAGGKYTSAGSALAAFIMAAAAGDLAAVTSFVQAGVDKEGQSLVNVGGIGRSRTALHAAAWGGHRAVVTYLLGQGASVTATDGYGDTPLHSAVASGNLLMVRELVGQGASVDAKNTASETPLHYAAAYGHLTIVKYLEGQGADLTVTSTDGLTATQTADLSGQTAVNTYLAPKTAAEARAELTRLGVAYTGAAFLDSAAAGNLAVVKLFVQAGMSLETKDNRDRTALHFAARDGRLSVVQYLVGQGASRTATASGQTALHYAAWSGRLAVVQYLVGQGESVSAKNGALSEAAAHGHLSVVQYLVGQGADVNAKNNALLAAAAGWKALPGAAQVVQYLVGQGADVNGRAYNGFTVLHWAVFRGNLAAVKHLVGAGASVTATDSIAVDGRRSFGYTALHFAAGVLDDHGHVNFPGRFEIITYLVGQGADVNATNAFGWTPLHEAVVRGILDVVKVLVGQGASLTATNNGWTALHRASWAGNLETVKYLVGQGASRTATDNKGKTPRALAVDCSTGQYAETLRSGCRAVVAYFDTL